MKVRSRSHPDIDDERRIYDRLTDAGRDALLREIDGYRSLVEVAIAPHRASAAFSPAGSTLWVSGT